MPASEMSSGWEKSPPLQIQSHPDLITTQENAYHPPFSTWGQSFPFIKSRFELPLPPYSGRCVCVCVCVCVLILFRNFLFSKKALEWYSLIFLSVINWSFTENPYPLNWWFGLLNEWKTINGVIFFSGKVKKLQEREVYLLFNKSW